MKRFVPIVALALAVAIFVIDAFVEVHIAIAVLYAAVVLMSITFSDRRGVLAVSAACMGLTVLAFALQHPTELVTNATARAVVSLVAIAIATFVSVWIQSSTEAIRSQAKLLDLTHDAIFVRDLKSCITYWNRAAENMYGWPAALALGKVSHDLLQTHFPVPYDEITDQLLRNGFWEGDLVHTRRDGSKLSVSSRWSVQRNQRGEPTSVLETNTDIEERIKLTKAQAELAHVSRVSTLGQLAASIAHEVNQPLAAIVMSGEACLRWLELDAPPLDRVKRGIERTIGDGRRASEVLQRLKALSRKGQVRNEPVSINEVIEDCVPLIHIELSRQDVSLELDMAKALPAVIGDRIQLQQVAINLMLNAVQAMASVTDRPRKLAVRTRLEDDNQIMVAIQDSGPGVDPAIEGDLFNAFFTTKPDGMGMGLSIVNSIIQAHHGRVWATRNDQGGATFQFTIPLHREHQP
ncbi:MAG TPA: ATP-binding protein [Burkholderiaceae bacterium]|nr:ATP-binding protein [Burkholderiaceae bacterium]